MSGSRPQRAVHPMRLPVSAVIHTTLAGVEPALTFRSLVACWSDALPVVPPTHRLRLYAFSLAAYFSVSVSDISRSIHTLMSPRSMCRKCAACGARIHTCSVMRVELSELNQCRVALHCNANCVIYIVCIKSVARNTSKYSSAHEHCAGLRMSC